MKWFLVWGDDMNSKSSIGFINAALALVAIVLGYKVISLDQKLKEVERNAAIAVLSAEVANNKIGAFAPYFGEDREKFVQNWIDGFNMPLAVVDSDVLNELKGTLARKRGDEASRHLHESMMKAKSRY